MSIGADAAGRGSASDLSRLLDEGCDALELPLPDPDRRRILEYVGLLAKWNGTYNLTAIRSPRDMLVQHVLDSLAVLKPLSTRLGGSTTGVEVPRETAVADVGSGAGVPGLVLAIAWPSARVTLVEPVGKKAAFLRQCAGTLRLPSVTVVADRVQTLDERQDLVICRAYASLSDFVTSSAALIDPRTLVAAMKGQRPDAELAALPVEFRCTEMLPIDVPMLGAERHLVVIRRDGPVPSATT